MRRLAVIERVKTPAQGMAIAATGRAPSAGASARPAAWAGNTRSISSALSPSRALPIFRVHAGEYRIAFIVDAETKTQKVSLIGKRNVDAVHDEMRRLL